MTAIGWRPGLNGREVFPLPDGEIGGPIGLDAFPAWIATHESRVIAHLERYFRPDPDPLRVYQGQHFEWFLRRSQLTQFTSEDFAAIAALSVSVPAQTARTLIDDINGDFTDLLSRCQALILSAEPDTELASCPETWLTNDSSPFVQLYRSLRKLDGIGPVVCSKLMASKFPSLVPIRDQLVEILLGMEHRIDWWVPIRRLLLSGAPTVDATLRGLSGDGTFNDVPVTRRLDVALWMEARSRGLGVSKVSTR